jgi:hypothetical protein
VAFSWEFEEGRVPAGCRRLRRSTNAKGAQGSPFVFDVPHHQRRVEFDRARREKASVIKEARFHVIDQERSDAPRSSAKLQALKTPVNQSRRPTTGTAAKELGCFFSSRKERAAVPLPNGMASYRHARRVVVAAHFDRQMAVVITAIKVRQMMNTRKDSTANEVVET